ncbi:hypothetical protein SK803_34230 [Lentzea sp. BCCO 10_0856]|uniref:Uncharacterized protein n=1 Tax=Lentzea miocenica TaxID=3095431 RepID=A0ABU4TAU5_9PSEU|nr:hypothetical protein [Lentzea sp. BCCO 10_0856]MDX8035295.1 hypothetical protein [Lentzea sp. BCCO 10_0856]
MDVMGTGKHNDGDSQDPTTVVGLLYRVVDKPHRVIGLACVSALPCGIIVQATSSATVMGISPGWIGASVSMASALGLGIARGVREIRSRHDRKMQKLAALVVAELTQEQSIADTATVQDNQ